MKAIACGRCGVVNGTDHKFCKECGQPLSVQTDLGREAARSRPPDAYTPHHLAEKILTSRSALEGERKLVTVLFVDVSGFTTISENLDPEDVHQIMDRAFELMLAEVHHYEGTVNQFLGDGLMALFGAPIAHEDHAVRAAHAALGIQKVLGAYREELEAERHIDFRVRIGMNTGTVVVGKIGDNLRMDYTAQGDTTNLAARLQQLAVPGGVWVGEATYRAAGGSFEWRRIGPTNVKGRDAPIQIWELLGRAAVRGRFEAQAHRGLTRFVGRDKEFNQLQAGWARVKQGRGEVVSVVGEAGLGKSRLLHEFKERLEHEGAPYLEGSCFSYGESISYLPFVQILKTLCGLDGAASEADAKGQIAARLDEFDFERAAVIPYLHNLMALSVDDEVFNKLLPHLVRERTTDALKRLVLALANRRPLVLIVEDVHWIDKATEEVLGALVEAMAETSLLLLLVYRPEYLHGWGNKAYHARIALTKLPDESSAQMVREILSKPYASKLSLARLSAEQSSHLVRELLGTAEIPPALEQLVATKTDGNPFFVEELTLSLLESGDLVRQNGGYILRRAVHTLYVPATVQGVLLARIDRLTDELKSVLQAAAVIGRVFSHSVLHQVLGQGNLDSVLAKLEDLEFVYPTSAAPHHEYSFKHVLTQQAVYDALLRPRRTALHEAIGRALEVLHSDRLKEHYELLAYHYSRSTDSDKALEYLARANRKAANANAVLEAKGYFDEALGLLDTLPATLVNQKRRVSLLVNQVIMFELLFRHEEYYDLLSRHETIAVGLDDPGLLGVFYACLGWCQFMFGHLDRSIETESKAVELCTAAGHPENAVPAYLTAQWSHMWKGHYDQVLALKERLVRTMRRRFHLRVYVRALAAGSWANTYLGRWDDAIADGQEALRVAEEYGDNSLVSFTAHTLLLAFCHKGDLAQAIAYGRLAVEKAPTLADKAWASGHLGWARCRSGEVRPGIEALSETLSIIKPARYVWGEGICALYLGEGYWLAGEHERATKILEGSLEVAERCGMKFLIGSAHRLLAEIAMGASEPSGSVTATHFEQSINILGEIKAENELALAHAGYGRFQRQRGNLREARDSLSKALRIFERLGTLIEPDRVRLELEESSIV